MLSLIHIWEYGNPIRPVMIHAQLLRPDQVPRLRDLGMIASFFVAHVYHWGDIHVKLSPIHI